MNQFGGTKMRKNISLIKIILILVLSVFMLTSCLDGIFGSKKDDKDDNGNGHQGAVEFSLNNPLQDFIVLVSIYEGIGVYWESDKIKTIPSITLRIDNVVMDLKPSEWCEGGDCNQCYGYCGVWVCWDISDGLIIAGRTYNVDVTINGQRVHGNVKIPYRTTIITEESDIVCEYKWSDFVYNPSRPINLHWQIDESSRVQIVEFRGQDWDSETNTSLFRIFERQIASNLRRFTIPANSVPAGMEWYNLMIWNLNGIFTDKIAIISWYDDYTYHTCDNGCDDWDDDYARNRNKLRFLQRIRQR